jgi:dTDP-4-dehydrorhamnose reductase
MRLLVFGKTGQVAQELARRVPGNVETRFVSRSCADLSDPDACAKVIAETRADVVINAAAWTGVDKAEADERTATMVNGMAPGAMARACTKAHMPFIHISTDYVFDGTGDMPFAPHHPPHPMSAYGRSKLAGEEAIRNNGAHYLILRTSWVISSHGTNFVKTMLRLGAERDCLNVVADQVGAPTPAASIADALYSGALQMLEGRSGGIYHFAGVPDTSWADFARAIMKESGLSCEIRDIPTIDYPTPARRPLNSRLDCMTFQRDFGIKRPDWRHELRNILDDLGAVQ